MSILMEKTNTTTAATTIDTTTTTTAQVAPVKTTTKEVRQPTEADQGAGTEDDGKGGAGTG